jgi:hypothetical protein
VLEGLPKRREASRRRGPPATPARPREPFGAGAPDGSRAPVLACINVGIALNEHTEAEGATVFRQACAMGLEGIVSKRLRASGPSRDWLKVKNPDSPAMVRHREGRW